MPLFSHDVAPLPRVAPLEKVEALPPEEKAEVEHFVDDLAGTGSAPGQSAKGPTFPLGLLDEINAERGAPFRDHAIFDTQSILRDLRENGGR